MLPKHLQTLSGLRLETRGWRKGDKSLGSSCLWSPASCLLPQMIPDGVEPSSPACRAGVVPLDHGIFSCYRHFMLDLSGEVPESAIDYDEVFRRGGANCGDEDFAMCKCPSCSAIYLIEYEVDTIYLSANDLSLRQSINLGVTSFRCPQCACSWPVESWIGPDAPSSMRVSWSELANSPWRWITSQTRLAQAE